MKDGKHLKCSSGCGPHVTHIKDVHECKINVLRGTDLKVLEAKDVKDPNGFKVFFPLDFLIDLEDDPGETLGI